MKLCTYQEIIAMTELLDFLSTPAWPFQVESIVHPLSKKFVRLQKFNSQSPGLTLWQRFALWIKMFVCKNGMKFNKSLFKKLGTFCIIIIMTVVKIRDFAKMIKAYLLCFSCWQKHEFLMINQIINCS